jgi:tetratricopeptide (TPR) repeat protein
MSGFLADLLGRAGASARSLRAIPGGATRADHVAAADRARDERDWATAVTRYRAAVALSAPSDGIVVQLGHALKESGQYEEAEAAYRAFLAAHPDDADIHLQLGHLFLVRDAYEEARGWYEKAHELAAPDSTISADAKRGLDACANGPLFADRKAALALTDRRRFREAYEKLTALVEQHGCEELTGILGNVCKELGRFGEASAYYARYEEQAARIGPDAMFDAALQFGHLAKVQRKYCDAIEHFMRAKALFAGTARPSCTLADLESEIRACLGQITKAIELH